MAIPLAALVAGAGRALLGSSVRALAGRGIASGLGGMFRGHRRDEDEEGDKPAHNLFQSLTKSGNELLESFKKLAIGTENLAHQFARVSPHLMVIFRLAQVQQMLRERRIGQDIAPAVRGAVQARQRREDMFAPLVVEQQKLRAHLSELADTLILALKPIIDFGAWGVKRIGEGIDFVIDWGRWVMGMEARNKEPNINQPWGRFWQDLAAGDLKRKRDRELGKKN